MPRYECPVFLRYWHDLKRLDTAMEMYAVLFRFIDPLLGGDGEVNPE